MKLMLRVFSSPRGILAAKKSLAASVHHGITGDSRYPCNRWY